MRVKKRITGKMRLRRYIFLAALLFFGVIFWNFKNSSQWDGDSRFTIVIQNLFDENELDFTALALFSIEPSQKRALLITIPDNTLLEVPYGYKTYPASSVYRLGELDPARGGGVLLSKTIEQSLGIAIDKYFAYENSQMTIPVTREQLQIEKHKLTSYAKIAGYLFNRIVGRAKAQSDIPLIDLLKIWKSVRQLRIDQINLINLEDSFSTAEVSLADGSRARKIDPELFDFLLHENLIDTQIRMENYSIEVVNSTSEQKVAGQMSRVLSHLGAHVLVKSTGDSHQKESCLVTSYLPSAAKVKLFDFLTNHYRCKIIKSENSQVQTDIKIILGEEFLK